MKVCLITSSLSISDGWGRYSVEVASRLKEHAEVKIITSITTPKEQSIPDVDILPLLPYTVRLNIRRVILETFRIRKHLIRDCDIVHCFVEPYAPIVALANMSVRKPFLITAYGTYAVEPLEHLVGGNLLRFAYKRANKVLCVSRFTQSEILKRVWLKNTLVIPNRVDYGKFQQSGKITKDANRMIILSVGAIKPRKGFDVSLKAFATVKKEVPNIEYYIAGEIHSQAFYNTLVRIAEEFGISRDVHFLGKVSEEKLIELYQTADIFMLTPRNIDNNFEGFGLVYLEAGASGKPVVASNSGGVPDAVIDRVTGLLVPEGDIEATARALKKILIDKKLAEELGSRGRERAKELSWDNYAKEILNIYEAVLAEAK